MASQPRKQRAGRRSSRFSKARQQQSRGPVAKQKHIKRKVKKPRNVVREDTKGKTAESPPLPCHFNALPVELFENVLLRLSMLDVLRCTQVNRSWKAQIQGSKVLMRHLFLTRIPKRLPSKDEFGENFTLNLIVCASSLHYRHGLGGYSITRQEFTSAITSAEAWDPWSRVELHPALATANPTLGRTGKFGDQHEVDLLIDVSKFLGFLRKKKGSWRHMHITQPAVPRLRVLFDRGPGPWLLNPFPRRWPLRDGSGIKLDYLVQSIPQEIMDEERERMKFTAQSLHSRR